MSVLEGLTSIPATTDFSELYMQYAPGALRLATGILRSEADAADAVQEAFLRVYKSLDKLSADRPFKPWLDRILINECYRIYGRRKKTLDIEEIAEPAGRDNTSVFELKQLIDKLPVKYREVILLMYMEGYGEAEIAEITRLARTTVKSRLHEARRLLRRQLETEV